MEDFFVYMSHVNVALAVFVLLDRVFFSRDTFFGTRRVFLLVAMMFALVCPVVRLPEAGVGAVPLQGVMADYAGWVTGTAVAAGEGMRFGWREGLGVVWGLGVAVLAGRLLVQVGTIRRMTRRGERGVCCGERVVVPAGVEAPFSFFRCIFLNPSAYSPEELEDIVAHERAHVRQWHWVDMFAVELLCIFCWFNPAVWLLRKALRQNLEFLADREVVASGCNRKGYQYHLLRLSCRSNVLSVIHYFNVSPLKSRIMMMNKKRTSRMGLLKYALVLPVAGLLVLAANGDAVAGMTELSGNGDDGVVQAAGSRLAEGVAVADSVRTEPETREEAFAVVEEMPQFSGGSILEYIAGHVRYPKEAMEKNIQGAVYVRFVVTKTGKVTDAEVLRGVSPELDAEALRVVNSMPDWIPARQQGKAVNVLFTTPIHFKLDAPKEEAVPLVIVDGKEMPAGFDVKSIKQERIVSCTVLKGEAAHKIYGEKGRNGVVVVETKE